MKVRFERPKGGRIKRANYKDSYYRPFWVEIIGYWYCITTNEFYPTDKVFGEQGLVRKYNFASCCYVQNNNVRLKSLKAVKRFIVKSNVPKGTWFEVASPYVGHSIKIRK